MTSSTDYFAAKLANETDPSDVYAAQKAGEPFVLVDVRSADAWAQGRIAGAVHMPYRDIASRAPHEIHPAARSSSTAGAPAATLARRELSSSHGWATP